MNELYREHILDHYKQPRNFGHLEKPDATIDDYNPLCGDVIHLEIKMKENQQLVDVAFLATGCVMSVATASLLGVAIKGKTKSEIEKLNFEDASNIIGIKVGPSRASCVLLPIAALHKALKLIPNF